MRVGGDSWPAAVISAVPWFALADLFADGPPESSGDREPRGSAMVSSPIVTVNLWFDRPVLDEPFIGLPGRAMQWVFDKRLIFGEPATHLSLVSSGASPLVGHTNETVDRGRTRELLEALPAAAARRSCFVATVVREPRATFSLAPGQPARP